MNSAGIINEKQHDEIKQFLIKRFSDIEFYKRDGQFFIVKDLTDIDIMKDTLGPSEPIAYNEIPQPESEPEIWNFFMFEEVKPKGLPPKDFEVLIPFLGSSKKVKFKCPNCDKEFITMANGLKDLAKMYVNYKNFFRFLCGTDDFTVIGLLSAAACASTSAQFKSYAFLASSISSCPFSV